MNDLGSQGAEERVGGTPESMWLFLRSATLGGQWKRKNRYRVLYILQGQFDLCFPFVGGMDVGHSTNRVFMLHPGVTC